MRKTLTIMTLALTTLATQAQAEGIHQELKQKYTIQLFLMKKQQIKQLRSIIAGI